MVKTVYFISSAIVPLKDGGGGSVVIYRHLKALENDGFNIVFINCNPNKKNIQTEFTQLQIPKRKWYPPVRKFMPLITSLRFLFYYFFVAKKIKFSPQDKVLSLLEDTGSLLAYQIYNKKNIPYYLFFHDDNVFSEYFSTHLFQQNHLKKIIQYCRHFFVVSAPMKELVMHQGAKNASVLYPIPEGNTIYKNDGQVNFDHLSFCYAGMILPFHDELVKKIYASSQTIGARLTLISNSDEQLKERFRDCKELKVIPSKKKLTDLFDYFLTEIDVLLIFYSFDLEKEIRATHSFPSKFVEFCHLGLPILIIAPLESAIGKWAISNEWLAYLPNDNQQQLEEAMAKFKNKDFWEACKAQSLLHATKEFNPAAIHLQLLKIINE